MSVSAVRAGGDLPTVERGDRLWHLGALLTFHVTGRETAGRFWVAEHWAPHGYGPALHSHDHEDELFVVLDGDVTLSVAGREVRLGTGGTGFGPRAVPHTFKVRSPTARFLVLGAPSGFEDWFGRTGQPAAEPTLPPPSAMADIERIVGSTDYVQALADFGVSTLGPALD